MKSKYILMGIATVVGATIVYRGYTKTKEIITTDLNPASKENIVNKGASKIVETVTGGKRESVADVLYCAFNSDAITCNPELAKIASRYNLSYYEYNEQNEPIGINPQVVMLYHQEVGL